MFPPRRWLAEWEDMRRFHVQLFRCFLLGLLLDDMGSTRLLTALVNAGLHSPDSHPLGRLKDACPPQKHDTFVATTLGAPRLYDEETSHVSGVPWCWRPDACVLGSGPLVVAYVVVWVLVLATLVWHTAGRSAPRWPRGSSTVSLFIDRGIRSFMTEDAMRMPGAWVFEEGHSNTCETRTDTTLWWDVVATAEDGRLWVLPGLTWDGDENDAGTAARHVGHVPIESNPSVGDRNLDMYLRCAPLVMCDADAAEIEIKNAVRENDTVATCNAMDASLDDDDLTDVAADEDEDVFGGSIQHPGIVRSDKKDAYRVLGRQVDGTLCDTWSSLSFRRTYGTEDETGDVDSYWTDQVNVRLSDHGGWSDGSRWPRERREDECDNWRVRNVQDMSDVQTRLRRFSSPPLNGGGSNDGPGVYVVPQKRERVSGGRSWSPVSSSRAPGLGFVPFRKTPTLLTPEAWRPGCLHVPDPPADEASQADAWWDSLNSVGGCGAGHMVEQDAQGQGTSWRDRHENNPASRRFHRRTMTEG